MKSKAVIVFIALLITYVVLNLTLPPDPATLEKYQISATDAKLLGLTVVIPITIIYLTALYGFVRVRSYAYAVQGTKEGPHFANLSKGLMILAFSLPISALISQVFNYVRQHYPHYASDVSVFRSYVALVFATASILLIAKGARGLFLSLRQKPDTQVRILPHLPLLGGIALACLFTWLILTYGNATSDTDGYGMPSWLAIATLAVPYTYIWTIGLTAATDLVKYKNRVKGKIYRHALSNIAYGIVGVVLIFITIQFIGALSGPLNRLNLTPLLLVIYALIILYAVGFALIARGSKKLKLIEEA